MDIFVIDYLGVRHVPMKQVYSRIDEKMWNVEILHKEEGSWVSVKEYQITDVDLQVYDHK